MAGLAPAVWFLYVFRFIAGMGIGGEYSAINSAIDELIPGKYRGRVDLAINGTYWAGAMLGAVGSYFLLDTSRFPENVGWQIAFFIRPVLGLFIIYLSRHMLVLQNFFGKTPSSAALYFFPFALGNLLGPLVLGPLFDTVGRRKMIGGSYSLAALAVLVGGAVQQRPAQRGHADCTVVPVVLLRLGRRIRGPSPSLRSSRSRYGGRRSRTSSPSPSASAPSPR